MTRNNAFREIVATGSGTAKVCEMLLVYFAANPDESLTSGDALVKFGLSHRSSILKSGRALQARGLVNIVEGGKSMRGGQEAHLYSAGPTLLKLIGRAA